MSTSPLQQQQDQQDNQDTIRNIKPPDMITDPSQFVLYERRLNRWSRLCSLSKQLQFDLILSSMSTSNPLCEKLEEEIGDSNEASTKGVEVILDKLREWFGKEEEIDAFVNYKEFENKSRENNQDLLQFVNEWESLYNKCKAKDDTLSDRVLAFKLIVSCNLTEMDHKLVFREAKSKEKDGKVYDRTKAAIRMFYNAGHLKTFSGNKTFNVENIPDDDQIEDNPIVKTLLAKGWKAPKSKNQEYHPYKKWFKCKWCKCSCEPADKRCDCPCSKHRSNNCPKKPSTESNTNSNIPTTLYTSSLAEKINIHNVLLVSSSNDSKDKIKTNNLSKYLYGLTNEIEAQPSTHSRDDTNEVLKVNHNIQNDSSLNTIGSKVIVDTACPKTLAGAKWFRNLFQNMPKSIRSQLIMDKSNEKFQFGGGERRDSLGCVTIPAYVLDDDNQAHMVLVKVEIVDADVDMLLGSSSLDVAEATLDLGSNPSLTLI